MKVLFPSWNWNTFKIFHTYSHPLVNSLWPSDAIWWQRSGSTLVQVMACCLTAPSHYLNQCWLIISKVLWHSSEDIIIRRFEGTNQYSKIEDYIFKITLRSPRGQWVNLGLTSINSLPRDELHQLCLQLCFVAWRPQTITWTNADFHWWCSVAFTWEQFHIKFPNYYLYHNC